MDTLWGLSYSSYLSFYLLFLFCSVVAVVFTGRDKTNQLSSPPEPGSFEPVGIALLRGGKNAVIRVVIFSLWQKQAIRFDGAGKGTVITRCDENKPRLSGIEQEIYGLLRYPSKVSAVFADRAIRAKLEKYLSSQRVGLLRAKLFREPERLRQLSLTANILVISIIALIVYEGFRYGSRHIDIFIISGIVASVIILSVLSPGREQSDAGKKYITGLQERFRWVKSDMQKGVVPEGVDPAFAFALFGVEVFRGSPLYQPVEDAFVVTRSNGGCSGGCGGCSNSSSSSDSSDGGGCSGGGCGGD